MDDLQISPSRNEVRLLSLNMPVKLYEIDPVDDFEIIGKSKEEYEIEQIDNISYQDKVIQNQYEEIEKMEKREERYNENYDEIDRYERGNQDMKNIILKKEGIL